MIKAVHMKSCIPYQQADIFDCKRINFIFGANGCGKSTVSSFLAGTTDPRYSMCEIEWESDDHENICVYNRDFRRANLQQTIPGIFTMGSSAIEDLEEIKQLKGELQKKEEEYKNLEGVLDNKVDEISKLESEFRDNAWNEIFKKNEEDFKNAFGGFRNNKEKLKQELLKRIAEPKGKVCERQELMNRANIVYTSKTERVNRFNVDIQYWCNMIDSIRTDSIWTTVISGNKDVDISALIEELNNSSWVNQGRQYIRRGTKLCPFCQRETISDDFRKKLEDFFDNEYQKKIQKMSTLLENYKEAKDHIVDTIESVLMNQNAVIIGKLDEELYQMKVDALRQEYDEHEKIIHEKIITPSIMITIPDIIIQVNELQDYINKANENIDIYNALVAKRNTEIESLTNDVWATCIENASSMISIYKKNTDNNKKAIRRLQEKVVEKKKEITRLKDEISQKSKNITSVQPTIDEINRSLKAYGFTNFYIAPADGWENYYCIKRPDGTFARNTLSEGEETFLTFLYFIQQTKGSIDKNQVNDKKIIVLDDPISSLDSTILYIVSAIVKELSRKIRNGIGDVSQLFVLTHNVFFHKEASFDPRQNMGNNISFWMIRKDNNISLIQNYGQKNPISTSYELLWNELRENNFISCVSIQNTMRRIIENYFGMLGKEKDETLISFFDTAEEQMIARSLLFWVNDGSHSIPDDLYIDSYTEAVPKYRAVFRTIFEKSNHLAHYNMMMGICNEPKSYNEHNDTNADG